MSNCQAPMFSIHPSVWLSVCLSVKHKNDKRFNMLLLAKERGGVHIHIHIHIHIGRRRSLLVACRLTPVGRSN